MLSYGQMKVGVVPIPIHYVVVVEKRAPSSTLHNIQCGTTLIRYITGVFSLDRSNTFEPEAFPFTQPFPVAYLTIASCPTTSYPLP
jgi:hypothetical protein